MWSFPLEQAHICRNILLLRFTELIPPSAELVRELDLPRHMIEVYP